MRSLNLRVFAISLIAQFLITMLIILGMKAPDLLQPLRLQSPQASKPDVFENVRAKLHEGSSSFQLNEGSSIITKAYAASDFDQASAYGVIDLASGEVIVSKELNTKLPIASITKVMTAMVALDLAAADEHFVASEAAASVEPTRLGVVPGDSYSVEELLNALLLTSANDAGEVLKEGIDQKYGGQVFIRSMNEKAKAIGLKNSHFENPQGYDGRNHLSSVSDVALMIEYSLLNYPLIKQIVAKDYQFYPKSELHNQIDLYNWNGLLGVYPNVKGMKIGNTDAAGYTTSVISEREGKRLLVIVLGAPGVLERDLWAAELLDLGYQQKFDLKPLEVTEQQLKAKYQTWKYWR